MEDIHIVRQELASALQREKKLIERNEQLNDFIENAAIALHWVNGSGIITWANQTELTMLGYAKEEYIGKHISNFHADKKVIEDILQRLINKETLKNYPSILKAKNGTLIPVLINSNVRWDGNKFIHTRCFTRDISDLKKFQEEKTDLIAELNEQNKSLRKEVDILKKQLNLYSKTT
jgi:two-component system sensor histidine kinase VicK